MGLHTMAAMMCWAVLVFLLLAMPLCPCAVAQASPSATVTSNIPYVTRPTGPVFLDASIPNTPGTHPAVILIHGGGFTRGNKVTYIDPMFQPLTTAGFAWFTIDYRMGPKVPIEDMIADTQAALDFVYAHAVEYHVDRNRIALLGESAGAYLADYVALKNTGPANVAALVSFYSPADLTFHKPTGDTRPGAPSAPSSADTFGVQGLSPEAAKQRLHDLSPYFMVRAGLPPTLALGGTADEQVAYEQNPRFCDALKQAGNKCEMFTVTGGRHGMGQWEEHADQVAYKGKVVSWLRETLR